VSFFNEYLERIQDLRATDRDPELFGLDEPEVEKFGPLPPNIGVYKRVIMTAYRLNKPLRYMDFVELLVTGEIGNWGPEKRRDYRGSGAMNFNGSPRRHSKKRGLLNIWFNKTNDGSYVPKPELRKQVLSGFFQPFSGEGEGRYRYSSRSSREYEKRWEQERRNSIAKRWS